MLSPGQAIGPYEIVAAIGAGGMGEVYRARDSRLDRTVAIKVMRPDMAAHETLRKRFLREARATATFSHPGIAAMYDAGECGDSLYLAMEYVSGPTLQQEIGNGPMSVHLIRSYALQIAAALEHAHAHGVLHRDIKPANIIVANDGVLKLLDFGLAQFIVSREQTATALTAAGTIVGTWHYCAPEVLMGRTATVRSDVYGLGVVMYEMACGRAPFDGLEGPVFLTAVLRGQAPAVRRLNPAASEPLANLIGRAMAPEPQDRFASAAEIAAALRTMEDRPDSVAIRLERARPVIAVLDFENLSGDAAMDWLGTGIAETITADLRKIETVQAVSRERVQQERARVGDRSDWAAIGRRMTARWLVTGSYQRAGNRIRITPKLVESATGEGPVLDKIDGVWDDLFALQDRAVRDILRALALEMDSSARRRIAAPETLRLEAYEQYAEGQRKLEMLGKDSLENARRHFESAIELDQDYVVAYAALGRTYAMRWIHRNDPDDLMRASGCLERALNLDPELGEPYGTLAYVYMRQDKLEKAVEAGLKAVRHNPDAYLPHYFLGVACWMAAQETSDSDLQSAVGHFLDAIQIEPAHFPSWLNLGGLAMETGAYDRSEQLVGEAMQLQVSNRGLSLLPFAEITMAEICTRRMEWGKALDWHQRAMSYLAGIDSIYRETAIALNACGMADLHLRENNPEQALTDAHRAWRTLRQFPRMMGYNRILTLTMAAMAAAYAALGDRARAEQLLNDAASNLETVLSKPGGSIHGIATLDLCHALAIAHLRLGHPDAARALLVKAVEKGWRDLRWLQSDPELAAIRQTGALDSVIERVRCFAPLLFGDGARAVSSQAAR